MAHIYISEFNTQDEITDFYIIKSCGIRIGANHKAYFDVTVGDRSGEINGKKWDVSDEESSVLGALKDGDVIKIKAAMNLWNGVKQLKIMRIRKSNPQDAVNMEDLVKAAPEEPARMFEYIYSKAQEIKDSDLKNMACRFLTDNRQRLLYYPGAMKNHHAEMGGLLYHMRRMLTMGLKACEVYTNLDPDWVACGVILHDMEKLNEIESNELGISPGYTFEGKMLGHIPQGVKTVDRMASELGLSQEKAVMLEHMILSHHYEPEFGSPQKPLFPEAELLHYLDMLDAKMYDFQDALETVEPGCFSERVRTLDGRMLYKPTFRK